MADLREADLPQDLDAVGHLWLDYLTWGNVELESRYGFRLPVREAVEHDLATIAKFQPPDGPDFMTAAHGLYRSSGFEEIGPYPESEIPDEYKPHWVFMERTLT